MKKKKDRRKKKIEQDLVQNGNLVPAKINKFKTQNADFGRIGPNFELNILRRVFQFDTLSTNQIVLANSAKMNQKLCS